MRRYTLLLSIVVWLAIGGALRLVQPPIPGSVMTLYLAIAGLAILVFVMADEARFRAFHSPLRRLLTEPGLRTPRLVFVACVPLLLGWATFERLRPSFEPPFEGRTIHPEPPRTFRFQGKEDFDVLEARNPLREPGEAARFDESLAEGKRIYFENCAFCHGPYLEGKGLFAEAFNPLPTNFRDSGTLSQLDEAYVFWRIATGGPGLPRGATPWNSAMPAWQDFLSEKEIWQVILYIYEASGSTPQIWGESGGGGEQ